MRTIVVVVTIVTAVVVVTSSLSCIIWTMSALILTESPRFGSSGCSRFGRCGINRTLVARNWTIVVVIWIRTTKVSVTFPFIGISRTT